MNIGVRLAYPAKNQFDWGEALKEYSAVGEIELAFYLPEDFYKIDPEEVCLSILEQKIKVSSIHLPHIDFIKPYLIGDVLSKISLMGKKVNCNLLVAHPNFGRFQDFEEKSLNFLNELLEKYDLEFCWETFSSKRRIFHTLEGLSIFCRQNPRYYICYDTSHIGESQDKILSDFNHYLSFVKVIHSSNFSSQKQHLPLWSSEGILNFTEIFNFLRKKEYSGTIILEYLPEFHTWLIPDCLKLKEKLTV